MRHRIGDELAADHEGVVEQLLELPLPHHLLHEPPGTGHAGQGERQVQLCLGTTPPADRLQQVDEIVELGVLDHVAVDLLGDPGPVRGLEPGEDHDLGSR